MGMQNVVEIVEHEDYAILYPRGYLNGPLGQQIDSACGELIQKGLGRIVISFEDTETMNTMV
ncbi:hypothetical protein HQ520_08355, partial [bacterium]|nr:hypothetical protein [bacterium]